MPDHTPDLDSLPVAVAAVVCRDDGRTLLVRRAAGRPAPGCWTPVTGRVEPGETTVMAAGRECLEETGLAVKVGAEVHRCITADGRWQLVWHTAVVTSRGTPEITLQTEEVDHAQWLTPGEASALDPMFPATRAFYAAWRDHGDPGAARALSLR